MDVTSTVILYLRDVLFPLVDNLNGSFYISLN